MNKGMIGLEIHAYPITKEKLFCNCKASRERGLKENTNICEICTGQPGAKPMLPNVEAVRKAVQVGLLLGCEIKDTLKWQRKHYDWPDMPKGFQNTISGSVDGVGVNGSFQNIGIWGMHLEEDPASWDPKTGCVDYNRSGLPLLEIITAPDFETAGEVTSWLRKLVHALSYLKAIDPNAGIKADVNVNIPGKTERVEIKNISSIEDIGRAVEYELGRQEKEGSEKETRRFDSETGETEKMRSKEDAEDYRFISDPDLEDIHLDGKFISGIQKKLPESPERKLENLVEKLGIDKENAEVLGKNIDVVEFFERVVDLGRQKKLEAKWIVPWVTTELIGMLKYNKISLDSVEIKIEDFVKTLELVKQGNITETQGKKIIEKFSKGSFDPSKEVKGKEKISDSGELGKIVTSVLEKEKEAVEKYNAGDSKILNFLVGQVMAKSGGRADFVVVRKIIEEKLG